MELQRLILLGGGGHCKSCIDVIESEGRFEIQGILDSQDKVGHEVLGYKIIGTDASILKYVEAEYYFLITIGQIESYKIREKLYTKLKTANAKIATIISPRAYISRHAKICDGTIIMHDAFINAGARVMHNCIINSKAIIEHDALVEAHCHVSTAAVVNGSAIIREGSFFGSNAVCKQGVKTKQAEFIKAGTCYTGFQKNRKKIAFLTTLFPVCDSYIHEFLRSLSEQTFKKFDLIVVNDGYENFERFKAQYKNLSIIEISPTGNIAKNREVLIKYAINNHYNVAVFGDIDDYFEKNRVEKSINLLLTNDIVINDLTTFSENKILFKQFLSQRITSGSHVKLDFILDKNVFGLSNTAVNLDGITSDDVNFNEDLVAVDWYFFSILLLKNKKAIFTNETVTFYRQHGKNTAGLGHINVDTILKALLVKLIHYKIMSEKCDIFNEFFDNTLILNNVVKNGNELKLLHRKNKQNLNTPLWWEII